MGELQGKYDTAFRKLGSLEGTVHDIRGECDGLRKSLDEMTEQKVECERVIDGLKAKVAGKDAQLVDLRARVVAAEAGGTRALTPPVSPPSPAPVPEPSDDTSVRAGAGASSPVKEESEELHDAFAL